MPEPLITSLIALTLNLGGMLVIYSFMAYTIVRANWHDHGVVAVLATIILAELFWIVPSWAAAAYSNSWPVASAVSLCFGNALVIAFAIVIFWLTRNQVPRQLEDSALLDGCGWFGIYRYVVLPLVKRELALVGFLTLLATILPFWSALRDPSADQFQPLFDLLLGRLQFTLLSFFLFASLVMTLPTIVLFFWAKRTLTGKSLNDRSSAVSGFPRTGG